MPSAGPARPWPGWASCSPTWAARSISTARSAEIVINGRQAAGVRLPDGTVDTADVIVSNGDVALHLPLPDPGAVPPEVHRTARSTAWQYSMSLFVIYFGTKRRYLDSKFHHHNIILNQRLQGAAVATSSPLGPARGLLALPAHADDHGPEHRAGRDRVLLCPCARAAPRFGDGLEAGGGPLPRSGHGATWRTIICQVCGGNIIAEHMIDPLHFRDTLNSYKGAAFSVRPSLMQLGVVPPAQPLGGVRQPLLRRRGNASRRRRAGGAGIRQDRGGVDRSDARSGRRRVSCSR